jgi:hypothetical protein
MLHMRYYRLSAGVDFGVVFDDIEKRLEILIKTDSKKVESSKKVQRKTRQE